MLFMGMGLTPYRSKTKIIVFKSQPNKAREEGPFYINGGAMVVG
jgi:hypothetical protein